MDRDEVNEAIGEIDQLLRFADRFSGLGDSPCATWSSGSTADGVQTLPWPVYPRFVEEFFHAAGQPFWSDRDYADSGASTLIDSDSEIAKATLVQLKSMLTFCVRGERFGDGHWDALIGSGRIQALLQRLRCIRDELASLHQNH